MRYHFGPSCPSASSDAPSQIWRRSGFHRYPTKSTEAWPSAASSVPHSRPRCCMETLDGALPPTDAVDSSETEGNCFQRNCTRDATAWLRGKVELLHNLISPVYMCQDDHALPRVCEHVFYQTALTRARSAKNRAAKSPRSVLRSNPG